MTAGCAAPERLGRTSRRTPGRQARCPAETPTLRKHPHEPADIPVTWDMVEMTEVSMWADSRSALPRSLTTSAFTAGTGPANMTPQQPDGGMDMGRTSDARSRQAQSPRIPDRPNTQAVPSGSRPGEGRTGSADHSETASFRAKRTTQRPQVEPLPSDASETCLCGDPADFVVDTQWFSGRHSRDPVCRRHVTEVVAAIADRQARRDGR
ncbi:hypothetical protein GCM10029978_007250 [Actinoallomurus acanthiterrae]